MSPFFRFTLWAGCLLFLAGCFGGRETIPAWRLRAIHARENYQQLSLEGKYDLATVNYRKAIEAIKAAGNAKALRSLILTQMALDILLDRDPTDAEESYEKWRSLDPSIGQDAFYDFLKTGQSTAALREDYKRMAAALEAKDWAIFNHSLKTSSPFSAVLTVKLASKHQDIPETSLALMIEIASEQGWKPILINALDLSITKAVTNKNTVLEKSLRLKRALVTSSNKDISTVSDDR